MGLWAGERPHRPAAISVTLRAVGEPTSPHKRGDRLGRGAPRRVLLACDEVLNDRIDRVGVSGPDRFPGRLELDDELGRGPPQIGVTELPAEISRGAPTLVVRARDPVPVTPLAPLGDDEERSQGIVDREDVEPRERGGEGSAIDSDGSTIGKLETEVSG
jgi:hypothetical protein